MKKRLSMALAGAALIPCLAVATQQSANASTRGCPTGCDYGTSIGNGSDAQCAHSNGGHYRAIARCTPYAGGPVITVEPAKWQVSPNVSYAFCPPNTFVTGAGIDTRST